MAAVQLSRRGMGGMMSGGAGHMLMGARSDLLGGDAGDVFYPRYLINGRPAADPETLASTPGNRVRVRIINAGSDTAFRVALGGHRLTVTHSDGLPVKQVDTDAILIGMGECRRPGANGHHIWVDDGLRLVDQRPSVRPERPARRRSQCGSG